MNIKLYTIGCPQCKAVEMQLKKKNIVYEEIRDENKMIELGFKTAPVLVADDVVYEGAKPIFDFIKNI